jgi:hypothetical protein
MRLQDFVTEAIRVRRLDATSQAPSREQPAEDELDDMPYQYPDDEPDFDFGDAESPDDGDDFDLDFGNNTGDESNDLNDALDQPLDTQNLNQAGLGSGSASTPAGGELENELSQSGEAVDGVDPAEQLASSATEDPNKQGVLRKVDGARLVYKRQTENGTYEELWAYNITKSNAPDSFKKRRSILAGTDIPPNKSTSPDGSQTYDIWTTSNAELIRIKGLQN